jgi:hypothetical protein
MRRRCRVSAATDASQDGVDMIPPEINDYGGALVSAA